MTPPLAQFADQRESRDSALARSLSGNDPNAWVQLDRQFRSRIFNYARKMGAHRDDAEDVASQTLIRVFRGIGQFHHGSALDAWVMRIAHNTFMDIVVRPRFRKNYVPMTYGSGDREREPADPASGPLELLIQKEQRRRIFETVVSLPGYLRLPFLRFYRDGRSYNEIAREANVPLGTVRSRLHRARAAVKHQIAETSGPNP